MKPKKQNFTRPFNEKLVLFDSKGYLKALEPYCDKLEKDYKVLFEQCTALIDAKDKGVKINGELSFTMGMVGSMLEIQKIVKSKS